MKVLLSYAKGQGCNVFEFANMAGELPLYDVYHFREDRESRNRLANYLSAGHGPARSGGFAAGACP